MPLIVYLYIYNKKMMILPKKFKEMLVKRQVAKQHKISSWGLGSWDPAAKEHRMVYDKQLRLYNDVCRGSNSLGGMRI